VLTHRGLAGPDQAPSTADVVDNTDQIVRLLDQGIAPPDQRKKAEAAKKSTGISE
jgi:hypothetical protein